MDKKRNLEYEKKFRAYLFSFDFETHKQICIAVMSQRLRNLMQEGLIFSKDDYKSMEVN